MAKKDNSVRNEQQAQGKPDDLHKLIIDSVHNAEAAQSLDNRFLTLAKSYCDASGTLDTAKFTADCSVQENWIKSDKAGKHKVNVIPGHWRNTKSTLLRAVKPVADKGTGKSLTEFNNMYELRKALPRAPRKPRTEKTSKSVVINIDPKIGALLATLGSQLDAYASLSLGLNQKGLDDLEGDLQDAIKANAAVFEHYKTNAEAYAKAELKVTGTSKEEPLDADEELDDTPDVIDEALSTQKPGVRH